MNPDRQTAHNTHPTTYSTRGPACLGQSRGRTDFPLMVFSFGQSHNRVGSSGCQGEQPWPLVLQRGRNRPPLEGIERSEQPSPTNTKGQGCEATPKQPLATHKLGRENNLQNNTQNRGGVPARTGGRYTPGHPPADTPPGFVQGKLSRSISVQSMCKNHPFTSAANRTSSRPVQGCVVRCVLGRRSPSTTSISVPPCSPWSSPNSNSLRFHQCCDGF